MREKRDETIILRLSKTEKNRIYEKMLSMGIRSLSAYIRKMALDGRIVLLDMEEIKTLVSLLRRTSANVNQIAKRVNSTSRVYENDLAEIQNRLGEVWTALDDVLRKLVVIE